MEITLNLKDSEALYLKQMTLEANAPIIGDIPPFTQEEVLEFVLSIALTNGVSSKQVRPCYTGESLRNLRQAWAYSQAKSA